MLDKKALQAHAAKLIREFGGKVRVTHFDGSVSSGYGLVIKPKEELDNLSSVTSNTLDCWLQGTLRHQPQAGDVVSIGSTGYTVLSVERISPDGALTYAYHAKVST